MTIRLLGVAGAVALSLVAHPVRAQEIYVGPMAGVSLYTFLGDDADQLFGTSASKSSRTGFAAGGFVEFELGDKFAIEPQLLYVQKGARYKDTFDGQDVTVGINVDYMQVPVLFKFEFREADRRVTPSIFAGPAVGFNIGCKAIAESGGESESEECGDDVVNTTDFSGLLGVGLEFYNVTFQARYDYSFTSALQPNEVESARNGGFLFTLGYQFRIK